MMQMAEAQMQQNEEDKEEEAEEDGALRILNESVAALRARSGLAALLCGALTAPFSAATLALRSSSSSTSSAIAAALILTINLQQQQQQQEQDQQDQQQQQRWWFSGMLLDALAQQALALPFVLALALPARTAIALSLRASPIRGPGGPNPGGAAWVSALAQAAFRPWLRACATHLCACAAISATAALTISISSLLIIPTFLLDLLIGVPFCILFAHLLLVFNLAISVSILEQQQQQQKNAVMAAIAMLRRRRSRKQVGLCIILTTTALIAAVDALFRLRVLNAIPAYAIAYNSNTSSSALWEAPLLIAIASFLHLLHATASTLFYFTCSSS